MKKGFTLIEVLVSIAIISILAASIFPVLGWMVLKSRQFQYDSEAATVLLEGTEATYNYFLSESDWSTYPDGNYQLAISGGNSWVLQPGGAVKRLGRFDQQIVIKSVTRCSETGKIATNVSECKPTETLVADPYSKLVNTVVSWTENSGPKNRQAQLLLTKLNRP